MIKIILLVLVLSLIAFYSLNYFSSNLVAHKIDLSDALVVDVRTKAEWNEGHSDKSVNVPMDEILKNIDMFKNSNKSKIVVVCRSGNRAGQVQRLLKENGVLKEIINLGAWQNLDK